MLSNAAETPLVLLIIMVIAGTITAVVAAIRKYRAGEIADDDAVIRRLDVDNQSLRDQRDSAQDRENLMRLEKIACQDQMVTYRVQLLSAGLTPLDRKGWADHGVE